MKPLVVNEKSTAYLSVSFLDRDGEVATPTQVQYRIDCMTSNEAVRALTILPGPAGDMVIPLYAQDTAIRVPSNRQEVKRVTVIAQYGSNADQATEEFDVTVKNLRFL